jgi:hypothetical protein
MSEFQFPVEAGHVMAFARTIDVDRQWADGEPVPPTFVMASAQYDPDYPLRPKPGQPWIDLASLQGDRPTLHAEQHFEYHRPPRVGDVLAVSSKPGGTWTKTSRSGQQLNFIETVTEYRDQSGELVVTTRTVAVQPEG